MLVIVLLCGIGLLFDYDDVVLLIVLNFDFDVLVIVDFVMILFGVLGGFMCVVM